MKCLHINLTKYAQQFYEENFKTLMKEIKAELNKWKYIPCSWIGNLNILRKQFSPKMMYRSSNLYRSPSYVCEEMYSVILKFTWKYMTQNSKKNLKEKKKLEHSTSSFQNLIHDSIIMIL